MNTERIDIYVFKQYSKSTFADVHPNTKFIAEKKDGTFYWHGYNANYLAAGIEGLRSDSLEKNINILFQKTFDIRYEGHSVITAKNLSFLERLAFKRTTEGIRRYYQDENTHEKEREREERIKEIKEKQEMGAK